MGRWAGVGVEFFLDGDAGCGRVDRVEGADALHDRGLVCDGRLLLLRGRIVNCVRERLSGCLIEIPVTLRAGRAGSLFRGYGQFGKVFQGVKRKSGDPVKKGEGYVHISLGNQQGGWIVTAVGGVQLRHRASDGSGAEDLHVTQVIDCILHRKGERLSDEGAYHARRGG